MSERSIVCLVLILLATVVAHGFARPALDVLDYAATLEPDIAGSQSKELCVFAFEPSFLE